MRHLPANHSMLMQYQPQKQLIFCLAVPHLDDFSSQSIDRNQSKSINQPKKSIYFKGQITNQNSSLNKHQFINQSQSKEINSNQFFNIRSKSNLWLAKHKHTIKSMRPCWLISNKVSDKQTKHSLQERSWLLSAWSE